MLDIQAKDKRGTTFIVEMQVENTPGLIKRFAYYVAKAYASQIERGEGYTELHRIIFIGILDFAAFQGKPYLSRHALLNRATHEQEIDAFEFVFIELPKFTKEEPELETILEKWIYFLKCAEDWEVTPAHAADTQALRAAYEIVHRFGWSRDELEVYEYWSIREQGEKEAVKEAHDEGRAEGLQEGEQRGRQAALRETARSMLAEGLETALVSKVTGLTVEEVATLLTDNCVNP
jgi:predicted transposase/invertase (TIGR01784 family)